MPVGIVETAVVAAIVVRKLKRRYPDWSGWRHMDRVLHPAKRLVLRVWAYRRSGRTDPEPPCCPVYGKERCGCRS